MKNRNAVYEARSRGRGHEKTEGAAKAKKGYGFLAKQGKICHGGSSGNYNGCCQKGDRKRVFFQVAEQMEIEL